jgi:hypothetical protein
MPAEYNCQLQFKMKTLLIIILTFVCFQVQSQNWIGNSNFLKLFEQSDIVVIGTISDIVKFPKDTTRLMPLKSLTLRNLTVLKGNFDKNLIYFEDFFNGCMYAPVLEEDFLNKETLIFAKICNDSIFQIESMNESPRDIWNSILNYNKISSSLTSIKMTDWFFECAKNDDMFYLLNELIRHKELPLFGKIDSINFTIEQRNWLYNKLLSFDRYDYHNNGITSILAKYNDETYRKILKGYLTRLRDEPNFYSDVDGLMLNMYEATGNIELKKIIEKFQKNWQEGIRKKLIGDFIVKI